MVEATHIKKKKRTSIFSLSVVSSVTSTFILLPFLIVRCGVDSHRFCLLWINEETCLFCFFLKTGGLVLHILVTMMRKALASELSWE
jgi:hypothetical protein